MKRNLLFKSFLPAIMLFAGVTLASAQTKPAVEITVKDCVYGWQASGSNTTGKYTQTKNSNKQVAYLTGTTCVYYLGEVDFTNLYSIEVKGAVLNPKDSKMAQVRMTSFAQNTFTVTEDALKHKSTEAGYSETGINDKVRNNANIFLNLSLSTTRTDSEDPRLYKGADFFITDKGAAQSGNYDGVVTFSETASINKINTSVAGTGIRQLFIYNGQEGPVALIDKIVFHYKDAPTATYTLHVGEAGATTLCLPFHTTSLPAGVEAYKLTYDGGETVTASAVTKITSQEPYLINAEPGDYTFEASKNYWAGAKDNALAANWATKTIVPADNYILTMKDGKVGFRKADGTTNYVNAFRCYLKNVAPARQFIGIDFENDETTGISKVNHAEQTDVIYNLQGVRVDNPTKGIYVKNGKKFIVK